MNDADWTKCRKLKELFLEKNAVSVMPMEELEKTPDLLTKLQSLDKCDFFEKMAAKPKAEPAPPDAAGGAAAAPPAPGPPVAPTKESEPSAKAEEPEPWPPASVSIEGKTPTSATAT
jgi:hypothetical protein